MPPTLLLICGYFTATHMFAYASVRFSEPLHPILLIIAVAAIQERWGRDRLRTEQRVRAGGAGHPA